METPVVKFNLQDQPEFFKTLRGRVHKHFTDNNISMHSNMTMKVKTVFMLCLYFIPFLLIVSGVVIETPGVIAMWAIMGLGMSGIGLAIMHDANHGSYSKNNIVNQMLGFTLNFIGGYHINWKIQHNVLHHTYTNIVGLDDDISKPVMRFSPKQKRRWIYNFQILYAPILYGLMTIYWFTAKDFEQLIKYKKSNLLAGQGVKFGSALVQILFHKTWYAAIFIALPIALSGIPWWHMLLGFGLMHFICGLILAFIFQPAHVVQETEFLEAAPNGLLENSWAIHQLKTTSSYAHKSVFFSWFVGGLNFQIEHHLFPNICHVHYKALAPIVRSTAHEFGLPYHEQRTYLMALRSHFKLLNQLGTGKYDKIKTEQLVAA